MKSLTSCYAYNEAAASTSSYICIVDPDHLCFSGLSRTFNTKVGPSTKFHNVVVPDFHMWMCRSQRVWEWHVSRAAQHEENYYMVGTGYYCSSNCLFQMKREGAFCTKLLYKLPQYHDAQEQARRSKYCAKWVNDSIDEWSVMENWMGVVTCIQHPKLEFIADRIMQRNATQSHFETLQEFERVSKGFWSLAWV